MADTELVSSPLPLTGDWLLTPALREFDRFGYRVVLEGVFRFAYTGEAFDALYRAGTDGAFSQRHPYLQWRPRAPGLEHEDPVHHRYVFRVPAEDQLEGLSVGVRVDVDRLVNEFLISPSEVRGALSGDVRMTVWQMPLAPLTPWPLIAWTSLPAALLVGGTGWVIRRRMAFRGLAPELQARLAGIERKHRAARAALGPARVTLFPLQERLTAVREAAFTLAREIQDLRNARSLVDRRVVEAETARLEGGLATVADEGARREGELALREKRKTLAALRELEAAEARCAMRLFKTEAVLESTCLTLRNLPAAPTDEPAEETLRRELDAEVAAIGELARELAGREALHRAIEE